MNRSAQTAILLVVKAAQEKIHVLYEQISSVNNAVTLLHRPPVRNATQGLHSTSTVTAIVMDTLLTMVGIPQWTIFVILDL